MLDAAGPGVRIVDGNEGAVIVNPEDHTLVEYEERQERYEAYRARIIRESHIQARTADDEEVVVQGNIELPEEVVSVIDNGGDGIGLYRTEFQYMNRTTFPDEFELFDKYRDVVEVMYPKPVTIRTLDINGDKALNYVGDGDEVNPVLGLRAIRYCLQNRDVFMAQLRAILRAAAYGNVRILFPMISNCSELAQAKAQGFTVAVADLSFFGTADRTSEYTVTPSGGNPTSIAAASTTKAALAGFTGVAGPSGALPE